MVGRAQLAWGSSGPPKGRQEGDALVPPYSKEDREVKLRGCD